MPQLNFYNPTVSTVGRLHLKALYKKPLKPLKNLKGSFKKLLKTYLKLIKNMAFFPALLQSDSSIEDT